MRHRTVPLFLMSRNLETAGCDKEEADLIHITLGGEYI